MNWRREDAFLFLTVLVRALSPTRSELCMAYPCTEIESLRPKSPAPRGERANVGAPGSSGGLAPSSSGSTSSISLSATPMAASLPNNPMRAASMPSIGQGNNMGGGGPQNLPPRMMGGMGGGQPIHLGMGPLNMGIGMNPGPNAMGGMNMGNMGGVGPMGGVMNMNMMGMNATGGRNMPMGGGNMGGGGMGGMNVMSMGGGGGNMGNMGMMNNQALRRNGSGFNGGMGGGGRGASGLSGGVGLGIQQTQPIQQQNFGFNGMNQQGAWIDDSSDFDSMGGMDQQGFIDSGQGTGMWVDQDGMNVGGGFAQMNQMGMGMNMGFGQGMGMNQNMNHGQWRGF